MTSSRFSSLTWGFHRIPEIFVMWDGYIRGNKAKKLYTNLIKGSYNLKRYSTTSEGYFDFLKDMQSKFKHIKLKGEKSLAKAIDEFNYMNITVPLRILEKEKKGSSK